MSNCFIKENTPHHCHRGYSLYIKGIVNKLFKMGNTALCTLSPAELVSYEKETIFSVDEIKALWMHFKGISGDGSDVITRAQFQELMLFRDTIMLDRIFRVFDANEDQKISFSEYLQCLSVISNKASEAAKLKLSFQMYDFDGDEKISVSDLTSALAATLREHDVVIERSEIDEIVRGKLETCMYADNAPAHIPVCICCGPTQISLTQLTAPH